METWTGTIQCGELELEVVVYYERPGLRLGEWHGRILNPDESVKDWVSRSFTGEGLEYDTSIGKIILSELTGDQIKFVGSGPLADL